MSPHTLLPSILRATQSPHQPLCMILDSPTVSGIPVMREMIRRAGDDDHPIILLTALHPPSTFLPSSTTDNSNSDSGPDQSGFSSTPSGYTLDPGQTSTPSDRQGHTTNDNSQAGGSQSTKTKVLDLTSRIPGYDWRTVVDSSESGGGSGSDSGRGQKYDTVEEVERWMMEAVSSSPAPPQVYIDALDILAEDRGNDLVGVGRMVRRLMRVLGGMKAPARLTLLLPLTSPLLPHLTPPSLTASLTLLTLHPPALISYLAETYLLLPCAPGDPGVGVGQGERFWEVLRRAGREGRGVGMRLSGEGGDEGDWSRFPGGGAQKVDEEGSNGARRSNASGTTSTSTTTEGSGVIVEILVRKTQGGAHRGMLRSLEGLRPARRSRPTPAPSPSAGRSTTSATASGSGSVSVEVDGLESCRWEEVGGMEGVGRKFGAARTGQDETPNGVETDQSPAQSHPSQAHIPFNLSLTTSQQASRAEVPIPYAHEGDEGVPSTNGGGAGGLGTILFEPGSDDDMDEDDPDEDLDF